MRPRHLVKPSKKLTFLLLSRTDRPVRRFKISKRALVGVPAAVAAAAAGSAIWQAGIQAHLQVKIAELDEQLAKKQEQYIEMENRKDATIGSLQTEIITLSEQSQKLQQEMDAIFALQDELKAMAEEEGVDWPELPGETDSNPKGQPVTISSVGGSARPDSPAIPRVNIAAAGGLHTPATNDHMNALIAETKTELTQTAVHLEELAEQMEASRKALETKIHRLRTTPSIWPASSRRITSGFGIRRDPFTGRASFHAGLDIDGSQKDPIYAAADGTVETVASDAQRGNYIILNHGNGIKTVYMHLYSFSVAKGDQVMKGDRIGRMGTTGRSTGTHLHYEVRRNGEPVNPMAYLR
ncbi:hypothetical protein DUZ99_12610 [Xylanibacillus composti]|uniref:Peptidase M24 n=1 Tax=Xylanibacillus composti TaxID=1572762 RepID=A0A8J4H5U2_9BACL|nr:peptidoglycan DD-metalloendopeptidase family protein [Xylanibacillus composti]MDT9725813.1 hypothetical protein [Xylanibacillus composti]GIQ69233.1 peptidase M24 [Xylanibacillus composti]